MTVLTCTPEPTFDLSRDRKVAPYIRPKKGQGPYGGTPIANSVGHLAGDTCPDMTSFCDACYAESLSRAFPAVDALLRRNTDLLLQLEDNVDAMAHLYSVAIGEFQREADKRNLPPEDRIFRLKWSGDIVGPSEATAIRRAALQHPDVQLWLYTRTFGSVHRLRNTPNLIVYLSTDADNVTAAAETKRKHPWTRYAFCGETWAETEHLAAKVDAKPGPRCPELTGRIPLVVWTEQPDGTTVGRGACAECRHCLNPAINNTRANIRFATK